MAALRPEPIFSADGRFIVYRIRLRTCCPRSRLRPGLFAFDRITGSNQLLIAKSALPGLGWVSMRSSVPTVRSLHFKTADAGLVAGDWNRAWMRFLLVSSYCPRRMATPTESRLVAATILPDANGQAMICPDRATTQMAMARPTRRNFFVGSDRPMPGRRWNHESR